MLDNHALRTLADDWYAALDRHAPLYEVTGFLLDEGLEMRFPETTVHGHSGFADWYSAVTSRFFDEQHRVTKVTAEGNSGEVSVDVAVNWQAHIWNPPAPASEWLGFDAYQTWIVVPDPAGERPKIKTYIVNSLVPMDGSAPL